MANGSPSSSSPLILGLDVGTSMSKAAIFELGDFAAPLVVARRASVTTAPRPGWSEADPDALLAKLFECIREVTAQVDADRIAVVGLSGTACGAWLLGSDNRPVRPAVLWNDGRSADILERWSDSGFLDTVFERSGNMPFPGYTLPTLVWLSENEPERLREAETVVFCKDWVRLALTGVVSSEETDASYVPFDIAKREWDTELFEGAGVGELTRLLPELKPPTITDPLLADIALSLGLPAGIPVAVGATDIITGLVGAGAVVPGRAVTILGTSANSSLVTSEPEFRPHGVGIMAAGPLGTYARTMINTSGSTTLDWAANLLAGGQVDRLVELASASQDGADLPVLVPYLSPAGVVSPHPDPHARGTISGLRFDHSPADLARAAIEGLALAVADSFQCMATTVTELVAVGGASRSDLLLQTIADASGSVVHRPHGEEFGARGAALLAAHSVGLFDDAELSRVAENLAIERTFEPVAQRISHKLDRYRGVRDATAALWRTW